METNKSIEDAVKSIMYSDDVDWVLDIKSGSLTFSKTYQLFGKIRDTLTSLVLKAKEEEKERILEKQVMIKESLGGEYISVIKVDSISKQQEAAEELENKTI